METEEVLVELSANLNYNDIKKYWLFTLYRGKHYKNGPVLYIIINIFGLLMFGSMAFISGFDSLETGIFTFLLIVFLLMLYLMIFAPKRYYKTYKLMQGSLTKYKFGCDQVEIETVGESSSGFSRMKYGDIFRVYEIDDYIYIFISNNQAFIIDKNKIPAERMPILRSILTNQVKKYYNYAKNRK